MIRVFSKLIITALLAANIVSCSIREDMDDCPVPVCISFECINQDYLFPDIVHELELLFYDPAGRLVYDLFYPKDSLLDRDWKVWLEDIEVAPGKYTLLAHVNYNSDEKFRDTGKQERMMLLTAVSTDEDNVVNYPMSLTDTYYGRYELDLEYDVVTRYYKVMLSKNTNYVNLNIVFEDESSAKRIRGFRSYVKGTNATYRWDNTSPETAPLVYYKCTESGYEWGKTRFTDKNKTMRIWHGSDLKIELEVWFEEFFHTEAVDIADALRRYRDENGDHIYDTDDKLEHYDTFDFTVLLNGEYVIVGIYVRDWFFVPGGVDL